MDVPIYHEGISQPLNGVVSELEEICNCPGEGTYFIEELKQSLEVMAISSELHAPDYGCLPHKCQMYASTPQNPGPFIPLNLPLNEANLEDFFAYWKF